MDSQSIQNVPVEAPASHLPPAGVTPRQFFLGLLLGVSFVAVFGWLGVVMLAPESLAHSRQQQADHKQALADKLLAAVQKSLPDDATEVTPLKSEYPYGWLTFVRVENGKRVKFLVWYKRDASVYTEPLLSVVRAD
jgi:hypothetical protein